MCIRRLPTSTQRVILAGINLSSGKSLGICSVERRSASWLSVGRANHSGMTPAPAASAPVDWMRESCTRGTVRWVGQWQPEPPPSSRSTLRCVTKALEELTEAHGSPSHPAWSFQLCGLHLDGWPFFNSEYQPLKPSLPFTSPFKSRHSVHCRKPSWRSSHSSTSCDSFIVTRGLPCLATV